MIDTNMQREPQACAMSRESHRLISYFDTVETPLGLYKVSANVPFVMLMNVVP